MKKIFKIIIFCSLFFTINNAAYSKSELKVGAILPLSGDHELLGNNIYQSILITIFELKNLNIKIIPLDTQSSKAGAINAFRQGMNKKVDLFVGPIFYDTLNEIKNIEGFKEKLFISYSNREENIFPNVINFGVNLSSQINSLVKLFQNNEQFIFFGDNSSFTKKVLEKSKKFKSKTSDVVFYKDFKDIGNQTKKITNYEERNKKHLEEIKKLEQIEDNLDEKLIESMKKHDTKEKVNFKKVFVSSFDDELISSISYFDFYDANYKDVQFVTLNLWFDNKYLKEPSLENLIFPSINLNGYKELNQKYKKNFGRNIYHLETLSFDIIPLASAIWFSTKEQQLKASMFNGTYKGKTGDFTIKENKTDRDLILYKIENKKFKKI
ncbi:amino acid/amide ABC transporter substrate-binding protein, HAAT family [alpha proteobacterium HIMB114]|nr:amino acid/amide ABC transporter substrate-binding protein, HAAT family [alpha proteobacterium HIMB114]